MPYGSLVVKFSADLAELQKDVRRVTTQISREFDAAKTGINRALGTLGVGIGVAGFSAIVKNAINAQDELYKLSQRVGVSVESLSELKYAGQLSDVSIEALSGSLAKFNKAMAETREGTGEAGVAFRALGISVTNSSGQLRQTDAVFADIAEAFAGMEDGAGKTAIAMRIFGRSGAELIPLLNQGKDGLKAAADEAKKFGIVISTDAAKAAEALNDNLTRLATAFEGLKISILNSAMPALSDWIEANVEAIKIAGGLGEALRLFVFNTEAMTTEKPREQIRRLTKELEDYQAASAPGKFMQSPTGFLFGGREEDIKKQIEFLKVLERQQALSGNQNIPLDPGLRRFAQPPTPKRAAPRLIDEGAAKKAADELKKYAEAASKLAEAQAKNIADAEKSLADERLKILDRFYAEGLLDEQEYWRTRLEIQHGALQAEVRAADQVVAEAQKAVTAAEKGRAASVAGATDYLNALRELENAQAKRNELESKFARLGIENYFESEEAAKRYADAIRDVNVRLLELQGRSAEAAAISFDAANKTLLAQARGQKDAAGVERIENLRAATIAQADFNDAVKRASLIQSQLATEEERIKNSREVGAISEIRSLQATGEARKRAVEQLNVMADDLERIAKLSGNVFLIQEAEAFRVEVERLATQTDLLARKFDQIGESAFSDFITEVIDGTKSISDAFRSMADSIVKQINRIAAEEIATRIFGGRGTAGGASGFGNFFASIFTGGGSGGFLSGLFGGGSSGLAIDAVLAAGGGGILPFASGGRFRAGQPMLVGEEGPELILPDTGGTVVPNGRFGGGMTVVNQFTISAPVDRRTQQQIAASAALGASRASRRNN